MGAQTFGWAIVYKDAEAQESPQYAIHERVHVFQSLIGGPLFLLAYGIHFLWLWLVKGYYWQDAYNLIWFEVKAYDLGDEYNAGNIKEAWGDR